MIITLAIVFLVLAIVCWTHFSLVVTKDENNPIAGCLFLVALIFTASQAALFIASGHNTGAPAELSRLDVGPVYVTASATQVAERTTFAYVHEQGTDPAQALAVRLSVIPPPVFVISKAGSESTLIPVNGETQAELAPDESASYHDFGEFLSAHRRGSQYILEAGNSVPLSDTVRLTFMAFRVNEAYLECVEQIGDYTLPRSCPVTIPSPCPYDASARYGDVDLSPLHIPATMHVLHVDEEELEFTVTWHDISDEIEEEH